MPADVCHESEVTFMYLEIDFSSDEAYYQQLCNQIILGIATSQFTDGQVLPSVRQLADDIGINMHTVNKAYSVLKQEGFVKVDRRKGAVISVDVNKQRAMDTIRKSMEPLIAEAICRDLSRSDMHRLVDEVCDEFAGYVSDEGRYTPPGKQPEAKRKSPCREQNTVEKDETDE
jgi:DNA-binding transcriptional regulator YhcF (GntR family)